MAFDFGRDLSVDRSFGGRSRDFAGIGRGLSVDSDRPAGSSDRADRGDSFFARQAGRSDPRRDPGYNPALDSELGDTVTRGDQISAINRVEGSAIDAFLAGNFATGLDLLARNAGTFLGVTEELATETVTDPATGQQQVAFGTRGIFNPLTLISNIPFGAGLAGAVAAGKALGPASGVQAGLDALGQRRSITAAGGFGPTIDLGFRPADSLTRRATARRAAGQPTSAIDQLAFDYAESRQASIDAAQRARENRPDRPPEDLSFPVKTVYPMVRADVAPAGPGAFGLVSGRDPTLGVDLLRTREGAAVAAGQAPRRPSVLASRSPIPHSVI